MLSYYEAKQRTHAYPLSVLISKPYATASNIFNKCPCGHRGPTESISRNRLLHEGAQGDHNPSSVGWL